MKVLGVVGPSNAGTTVVERLAEQLADRGTVGTVRHVSDHVDAEATAIGHHRAAGAATTYGVGDDGWFATGGATTLDDVLDRLATDHDYALVEGYAHSTLPTVVLGDRDASGPVVAEASDPDDVDVDAVVTAVEDLEPYVTLESLVARVKRAAGQERSGAIATFTGRVRRRDGADDVATEHLEFEKYEGVADERMAALREELCARDGVYEVLLHHKTGVVEAGEDIVFVVVLAGHRIEAFATVEDGIDRLKAEVPLFKKEVTVEGEYWAHERDGCDHGHSHGHGPDADHEHADRTHSH